MLHYSEDYIEDVLVRFAYHSTGIEGNHLTIGETKQILLNNSINTEKKRSLREIYEVQNHRAAFKRLLNEASNNRKLDLPLILDFQRDLTQNTIASPGQFKQSSNYITGADFETASPQNAPILVREWCDNLNYQLDSAKNEDQLLESLLKAHVSFEKLHPFDDGNGRTGRLVMNFELCKRELPFLVIRRQDRDDYINYLSNENIEELVIYSRNKMLEEKKRYNSFENNYQRQHDFELKQFKKLRRQRER